MHVQEKKATYIVNIILFSTIGCFFDENNVNI